MNFLGYDLISGPPICVAEISGNHGGSLEKADELIYWAKEAGAHAVKFQCYDPESLTIDCDNDYFRIRGGPWNGKTFHQLYQEAATPLAWLPLLAKEAQNQHIPWFASVFCDRGLAVLESLGCGAYKVASMEIGHTGLIRAIAQTQKPIVISTGMAGNDDIEEALSTLGRYDPGVGLLHCISGYPTPTEEANLPSIKHLQEDFCDTYASRVVGLSDHTTSVTVPAVAVGLGAKIIEKHLTLDPNSVDGQFSLTPIRFNQMVIGVKEAWEAIRPRIPISQDDSFQFRRSLFVVQDIKAGEMLTHDNVRAIRPNRGLPPAMIVKVMGRRAAHDLARGTPLAMSMVV